MACGSPSWGETASSNAGAFVSALWKTTCVSGTGSDCGDVGQETGSGSKGKILGTLFSRCTQSFLCSKPRIRVADLMKYKKACSAALYVFLLHPPDPVIFQPCFNPNLKHGVVCTQWPCTQGQRKRLCLLSSGRIPSLQRWEA